VAVEEQIRAAILVCHLLLVHFVVLLQEVKAVEATREEQVQASAEQNLPLDKRRFITGGRVQVVERGAQ